MAKHIVFDYEFDASAGTVVLDGIYSEKRLLLMTNVNDNKIIYSFSDPSLGATDVSFDYTNYKTTVTLAADTTAMADTDPLQIFVEYDNQTFQPAEAYTDPVSKFRVSTPENLIDTDFEYGLQSTKWETLELTKNIPTFFARNGDLEIAVTAISAQAGSDIITVTTESAHSLQRGSPIILIGTTTILADGGFVVASVPDTTTFTYKCKGVQPISTSILETYTQVFAGSVYSATEFKLKNIGAITTDSADPSVITVNTEDPTNFTNGTSMVLSNTFAKTSLTFSTDDVEPDNTVTKAITRANNAATGEDDKFALGGVTTAGFVAEQGVYFEEGTITVDTTTNKITLNEPHGWPLTTSAGNMTAFVYMVATNSNTSIGGLEANRGYFAYVDSTTSFYVHNIANLNTFYRRNLTSNGVSGGVMKSGFLRAQFVFDTDGGSRDYIFLQNYLSAIFLGTTGSSYLGQVNNQRFFTAASYNDTSHNTFNYVNTINEWGDTNDYFIRTYISTRPRVRDTFNGGTKQLGYDTSDFFAVPVKQEDNPKRGSFYVPNHGAQENDLVVFTANTGTMPANISAGTTYLVEVVDDNRIRVKNASGATIYPTNEGSADLNYTATITSRNEFADTVLVANNEFQEGDALVYDVNGGTVIGGLTDATTYYVARKNGDYFNLSTSANSLVSTKTFDQTTNVNTSSNQITVLSHGYSNGDTLVYVSSDAVPGLTSNRIYFARSLNTNTISLHPTSADAVSNTNIIQLYGRNTASGKFEKHNVVDLTSVPSPAENQIFVADFIGAGDGIYEVASTAANQLSFTFNAANQITPRTYSKSSQDIFVPTLDGFYDVDHGFVTGDEVTVTLTGTTNITGITSGNTYYIISKSKDFYQLAASEQNALDGTFIALTDSATSSAPTGTVGIAIDSIVGRFAGSGTISYTGGTRTITGTNTVFTSYFNKGDTFLINISPNISSTEITSFTSNAKDEFIAADHGLSDGDAVYFTADTFPANIEAGKIYFVNSSQSSAPTSRFTVHYSEADALADTNFIILTGIGVSPFVNKISDDGDIVEREIDYVNSDTEITVTTDLPTTNQTDTEYFLNTQLLLRSDGFALHRPYDGGVELIPSSNPDSQMIRQTRKYFRYQSGKGIQVSFAVNFSPTSQIDTFSASGTTGTITTRFPHRLSQGLYVTVSGSTNTNQDTIGTKTYNVSVLDEAGQDKFKLEDTDTENGLILLEGRTYRFDQSDSTNTGELLKFSTEENGGSPENEYTTGVTKVGTPGTAGAYTEIVVAADAPNLFVYGATAGIGFAVTTNTDPDNNQGNLWNGSHEVLSIVNDTTFTVALDGTPSDSVATGVVEYYVNNWARSSLRCGLYDDQNGIFFEYDGEDLYVCRRSSILQLSGYMSCTFRAGQVNGTNTKFASQLAVGDAVVIKGQTHIVSRIDSDTQMFITPSYRGVTADKIIGTKVQTTRVKQSDWNLDQCDGTGHTGFKLDIHKIQMAYVDYSWYGAGKVRFGFKDQNGDVKYVHQLVHGNFFTEAYMRSGNLPARYEIQNLGDPSYVPALAHWGTSVIMDGRFDNDKAYVFNASSNNITLLNTTSLTTEGRIETTNIFEQRFSRNYYPDIGYAITLASSDPNLASVTAGTTITGAGLAANTAAALPINSDVKPYQPYLPDSTTRVYQNNSTQATRALLIVDKQPTATAGSDSTYTIGNPSTGLDISRTIPLISVRLAPSVDTSTPGSLGEREIINRMQLILNQVAILSTHTAEIELILNGQLSTNEWTRVTNPSLSQLLVHASDDTITGGARIFNFRASGDTGTTGRVQQQTTADLGDVATLGNSILGGDNVFPDGPDVVTVCATLSEDPSTVSSTNPFIVTGRVSWSESQA